jgi:hypothetical protein
LRVRGFCSRRVAHAIVRAVLIHSREGDAGAGTARYWPSGQLASGDASRLARHRCLVDRRLGRSSTSSIVLPGPDHAQARGTSARAAVWHESDDPKADSRHGGHYPVLVACQIRTPALRGTT